MVQLTVFTLRLFRLDPKVLFLLDRVLDGALQVPLSEQDHHKLREALHAMAAMLVRPRNTEKTSSVVGKPENAASDTEKQSDQNEPPPGHGRNGQTDPNHVPDLNDPTPESRIINFNRTDGAHQTGGSQPETVDLTLGAQHWLLLKSGSPQVTGDSNHSLLGVCVIDSGEDGVGLPRDVKKVVVNKGIIGSAGRDLGSIIAHELSHGCDVPHHGEGAIDPSPQGRLDAAGQTTSGETQCFMRYDNSADYWVQNQQAYATHAKGKKEPPGDHFCQTTRGNGCNVQTRRGVTAQNNATTGGDCRHKLAVKDN